MYLWYCESFTVSYDTFELHCGFSVLSNMLQLVCTVWFFSLSVFYWWSLDASGAGDHLVSVWKSGTVLTQWYTWWVAIAYGHIRGIMGTIPLSAKCPPSFTSPKFPFELSEKYSIFLCCASDNPNCSGRAFSTGIGGCDWLQMCSLYPMPCCWGCQNVSFSAVYPFPIVHYWVIPTYIKGKAGLPSALVQWAWAMILYKCMWRNIGVSWGKDWALTDNNLCGKVQ